MGKRKRRPADRALRPAMRSPGRPPGWRRKYRQRFWEAIAGGLSSEEASVAAGLSPAVGTRWFRQSGGMPLFAFARCWAATCRSLSEKRSPSSVPRAVGCVRSLDNSIVPRRRSRGSCVATRRPVGVSSSIGLLTRSGMRIGVPRVSSVEAGQQRQAA